MKGLINRERPRPSLDIYRFRHSLRETGSHFAVAIFNEFFEQLARIGVGKYHFEKLPGHCRFEFDYPMIEVGRAGMGNKSDDGPIEKTMLGQPKLTAASSNRLMDIHLPYRDTVVRLSIPGNLTLEDADQMANYLRAIAKSQ
jgi:hypothetical protein